MTRQTDHGPGRARRLGADPAPMRAAVTASRAEVSPDRARVCPGCGGLSPAPPAPPSLPPYTSASRLTTEDSRGGRAYARLGAGRDRLAGGRGVVVAEGSELGRIL